MAVDLPPNVWPDALEPRLIDYSVDQTSPLGGPTRRIGRPGSRFAAGYSLPSLDCAAAGDLIGALAKARAAGDTIGIWFPQTPDAMPYEGWDVVLDFIGAETEDGEAYLSSPTIDGAGQAGTSLDLKGMAGTIGGGAFFSFAVSGVSYLHMVTTRIDVPDDGEVTVDIAPMLRASPADDTAVAIGRPKIEGYPSGSEQGWSVNRLVGCIAVPLDVAEAR